MTAPKPYDVALDGWLNLAAFHPADTPRKQLAHEAVRQQIARLGVTLHAIVPPGPQKSLAFSQLSYVLMLCNQALAVNGGPTDELGELALAELSADGPLKPDQRVEAYKAEQLIDADGSREIVAHSEFYKAEWSPNPDLAHSVVTEPVGGEVHLTAARHNEGENVHDSVTVYIDDPMVADTFARNLLAQGRATWPSYDWR